ncbi:MAG: hypothetical protein JWL70_388 [Acidimicrobiia bacterium]|nr:hypothetical protein [Acidimicrobiia bacterium]
MSPDSERWNRNIHYHPLLLALGPANTVLDVGCGGGLLTRQLAVQSAHVVGIDVDAASIREAEAASANTNITYLCGDVLTHPFEPESFDLVVCVAALHHFDAEAGLRRFAELTKPGGQIGVIGIGRSEYPRDLARDALTHVATFLHRHLRRTPLWHHNSPMVWPPPLTDRQIKSLASTVLPGATVRRRLHGRHSILWTKPMTLPNGK